MCSLAAGQEAVYIIYSHFTQRPKRHFDDDRRSGAAGSPRKELARSNKECSKAELCGRNDTAGLGDTIKHTFNQRRKVHATHRSCKAQMASVVVLYARGLGLPA